MAGTTDLDLRETLTALCKREGLSIVAHAFEFSSGYLEWVIAGQMKAGPRLKRLLLAEIERDTEFAG